MLRSFTGLHRTLPRTLPARAMSTQSWNRLVRFRPSSAPSTILIGEPVDQQIDVGVATYDGKEVEVDVYTGDSIIRAGERTGRKEVVGTLLSPLAEEEVGTIRCIGLNYKAHAIEAKLDIPTVPIVFLKPATSLAGPHPDAIVVPHFTVEHQSADYEAELGVIIGKDCKNVSEADALDYVLGYTATNDVSSRKTQFEQSQWCRSKSYDKACPIGPVVVSPRAIPDPSKLRLKGIKNGKTMQDGPLSDLIFPIPHLISFLSQGTTLRAGTLILTGTPAGIGFFFNPPDILLDGDEFRVEVDGGIGSLINRVDLHSPEEGRTVLVLRLKLQPIFLYLTFFGFTWLELPWLYPAEINPLKTRTNANAVSAINNWLFNFTVVMFTPPFLASSAVGCFAFFGAINLMFLPVIYLFYPETAGRSLEEIDIVFARGYIEGVSYVKMAAEMPRLSGAEIEAEWQRLGLGELPNPAAAAAH